MDFIQVTLDNLEKEHICCAICSNNDCQVTSKKAWLSERLQEGLVFLKADTRGKCFIEYLPAEMAWVPVKADGYMWIDCLWVSGALKGQGYSNQLLSECIRDSKEKGKKGLAILSSDKKRSFLADKKYLLHKGFQVADRAEPYFELLYLPFEADEQKPSFKPAVKMPIEEQSGFVLYYTHQCPFTAKYVPLVEQCAKDMGLSFQSRLMDHRGKAQNALTPFTAYSLFYNGKFVTHEILSVKKFEALAETLQGKGEGYEN